MKKISSLALIALPLLLTACGGGSNNGGGSTEDIYAEGAAMTNEQLLEKAKEESGNFVAYGTSSRISTAVTNFIAKYPTLGLTETTAKGSKLNDSQIYTLLSSEYSAKNNSQGASFVLLQDSATLANYRSYSNMLVNYVSNTFKTGVAEDDLVPLVHQYCDKLFIWNNTAGESAPAFTNVWQLTEDAFKGKIFFKSPVSEQVNMNFLITLTSPSWIAKMESAYKAYFKTDYVKSEAYESASHEWIAKFLGNADITSYTSDTKIAGGVSSPTNSDKAGLFVLSKLRDKSVADENLTVGAWTEQGITPFAGFMYALYAQITSAAPRPYTAMLFTNYLMSEEGFAPWGEEIGAYSGNQTIAADAADKKTLAQYKDMLVVEDGEYINTVKTTVTDWITQLIA